MTSKQARWEYIVCVMGESKRKVTDQYSTVPHQHAGPVLAVVQDVALVDVAVAVDHPASFEVALWNSPSNLFPAASVSIPIPCLLFLSKIPAIHGGSSYGGVVIACILYMPPSDGELPHLCIPRSDK